MGRSQGAGIGQEIPVECIGFKILAFSCLGLEKPFRQLLLDIKVFYLFHEEIIDGFKFFIGF